MCTIITLPLCSGPVTVDKVTGHMLPKLSVGWNMFSISIAGNEKNLIPANTIHLTWLTAYRISNILNSPYPHVTQLWITPIAFQWI